MRNIEMKNITKAITGLALAMSVSIIGSDRTIAREKKQTGVSTGTLSRRTTFNQTEYAAKEIVFSIDTGIITLGPSQTLRIVTNNNDPDVGYVVRFSQMTYSVTSSSGTSRYTRVSQSASDPIPVAPGEGFSIDIGTSENLRVVVSSDTPELQVTAQIIDAATGNIIAILLGLK
jgi:hypothetical protein